jgi:uracil-DNA glycosylase family 4
MTRWTDRQHAMLREMGLNVWACAIDPARSHVGVPAHSESTETGPLGAAPMPTPATAVAPVVQAAKPVPASIEVATMDWDALRAAVAACTACGLCAGRKNTVFGTGHRRARWMIVGEAPGEQEDLRGEPFVGKSGQLLDRMLAALRLTRADGAGPDRQVYIANTLKCRPPANRNPEPDEIARCEPFLVRQIELVQPSVIVAMGRFAVQALLRSSEPIGRLRGRVHRYRDVPLVVTYHPAYLLRNLQDKARTWEDLCLAKEVARAAPSSR